MHPLKITLDTNCVINFLDSSSETATSVGELTNLIRYALSGRITVSITTRVESDLLKDRDSERQTETLRSLAMFPVNGTVGRWGVSQWGTGDLWTGPKTKKLAEEIQQIVFPGLRNGDKRYTNKMNDVDHLVGHLINKRDIFVTDDRGILRRKRELQLSPGLNVMSPSECVHYIDELDRRAKHIIFESGGVNPKYHSPGLQGRVQFDYSNNNHRYAIGEGRFLFETRWSKASDKSIRAYSRTPSIDGIALAKGCHAIGEIRDASIYDFSSDTRAPRLGQIVVWRNVNGIYAATKILDIKDDTRGAPADELAFEYIILSDGGTDFSREETS